MPRNLASGRIQSCEEVGACPGRAANCGDTPAGGTGRYNQHLCPDPTTPPGLLSRTVWDACCERSHSETGFGVVAPDFLDSVTTLTPGPGQSRSFASEEKGWG